MQSEKRTFEEIRIPVPWGHVAAKVYGPPMPIRVLLVHGSLDNAGSFDRLLQYLPTHLQYVSIDLPGHGLSSYFPKGLPLNFFNYVHTIKLVLNYLEWQSCIYIGHSLGANIGFYFNLIYPKRIERMVALDGLLSYAVEIKDNIAKLREYYDLESYATASNRLYTKEEILHALQFKRNSVLNSAAAEALFERAVTKVGDLYMYNRDPRLRKKVIAFVTVQHYKEFVRQYTTPTLLFLSNSQYRPTITLYIEHKKRSNKNTDVIDVISVDGNHDFHNNNPEKIVAHICKFLYGKVSSKL